MLFNSRKYWHTPPLEIIGGGETSQTGETIAPDYIAQLLEQIGLPCTPAGHTSGAQIATYHYNLIDLRDYTKAARAVKAQSERSK